MGLDVAGACYTCRTTANTSEGTIRTSMASDARDFGAADKLQAAAVGLPGQRTFHLQFLNDEGRSARLWIEKEQLIALGNAIEQLMAQTSDDPTIDIVTRGGIEEAAEPETFFPEPVTEFKIGQLALGYDEKRARFTILVHDVEGDPQAVADFRCLVTRELLQRLGRQIGVVVSSGRPRCPLCGTPLQSGVAHFCPPSNGYAPVQLVEEDEA